MKTLLIISTLLTSIAFGKVIDPNDVRAGVSNYLAQPTYESSFAAGDWLKSVNRSCIYTNQQEDCEVVLNESTVVEVKNDRVLLSEGGEFPRALFEKYQGSFFDFLLDIFTSQSLEKKAKFNMPAILASATIIEIKEAVIVDSSIGLEVLEVRINYISNNNGQSYTIPMYVQLSDATPWLAQVVMMGLGESSETSHYSPFYEVISWTKN